MLTARHVKIILLEHHNRIISSGDTFVCMFTAVHGTGFVDHADMPPVMRLRYQGHAYSMSVFTKERYEKTRNARLLRPRYQPNTDYSNMWFENLLDKGLGMRSTYYVYHNHIIRMYMTNVLNIVTHNKWEEVSGNHDSILL